ncbi:MAG: hypothetical protein J7L61_00125 [Thermoplasmata archaeon]|nr:hypothetical protein [Thermoplasmata archaeon]
MRDKPACAAVVTCNFRLFPRLIEALQREGLPFIVLSPGDPIPPEVTVVLTGRGEAGEIGHPHVVEAGDTSDRGVVAAVLAAGHVMSGRERYGLLAIGIDPGERPGVAVVGDGEVVKTFQLVHPEDVREVVEVVLSAFPHLGSVIRIGHGDPVRRNRIINSLLGLGVRVEVVDETRTSGGQRNTHVHAAIYIASWKGIPVENPQKVEPTPGEIREIQRRSRIESGGHHTIDKELAAAVARGEMSMGEAVKEHERRMGLHGEKGKNTPSDGKSGGKDGETASE